MTIDVRCQSIDAIVDITDNEAKRTILQRRTDNIPKLWYRLGQLGRHIQYRLMVGGDYSAIDGIEMTVAVMPKPALVINGVMAIDLLDATPTSYGRIGNFDCGGVVLLDV